MSVKVGLHWLAFTTKRPMAEVLSLVCQWCHMYAGPNPDQTFYQKPHGGRGYERIHEGWKGIKVYSTEGREDVHIEIPGEACEWVGSFRLLRLWDYLGGVLRRVDVALDGLVDLDGQPITPGFIYAMAIGEPEKLRTWAKLSGDESVVMMQNRKASTTYIGAASSERRVRIYDRRGETRMELQVRGDRAESYGDVLEGRDGNDLPKLVVGFVRSFLDFIEPAENKSRGVLQPWWAAIVGELEKIETEIPHHTPTIESKHLWLQVQVRRALAIMHLASDGCQAWFGDLLQGGVECLTKSDKVMIEQARAVGWVAPPRFGAHSELGLFDKSPLTLTREFLHGV